MNSNLIVAVRVYQNGEDMSDWMVGATNASLKELFELDDSEVGLLKLVILSNTNESYNAYNTASRHGVTFGRQVTESLHQSLDGWTEYESIIIQSYLADLAYATNQALKG